MFCVILAFTLVVWSCVTVWLLRFVWWSGVECWGASCCSGIRMTVLPRVW